MSRRFVRWGVVTAAAALLLAACSNDTGSTDPDASTSAPPVVTDDIAVDTGVDLDAGVIRIGMLADLTGDAGPLVTAIFAGHEVYWDDLNANGGIHGMRVELNTGDTMSDVDTHVELYEELKTEVVAFGHSTGLSQTLAITDRLEADGVLAIPLAWHSAMGATELTANLAPHGVSYCLDAMNLVAYGSESSDAAGSPTVAILSTDDQYGRDTVAGARLAIEELGLDVVYDGEGRAAENPRVLASELVSADPDLVLAATTPTALTQIFGPASSAGLEAMWLVPGSSYNAAALDSPHAEAIERDLVVSSTVSPWGSGTPGNTRLEELIYDMLPTAPPTDYYAVGVVEARILHEVLLAAFDSGDMTQAGVLAAARSLSEVSFDGLAPEESYTGATDERLQRTSVLTRPDVQARLDGGTGSVLVDPAYVSDVAAAHDFTGPCSPID